MFSREPVVDRRWADGVNGRRAGTPEAVAPVYLVSEEAAFVHGVTFDVDGGRQHVAVIAE